MVNRRLRRRPALPGQRPRESGGSSSSGGCGCGGGGGGGQVLRLGWLPKRLGESGAGGLRSRSRRSRSNGQPRRVNPHGQEGCADLVVNGQDRHITVTGRPGRRHGVELGEDSQEGLHGLRPGLKACVLSSPSPGSRELTICLHQLVPLLDGPLIDLRDPGHQLLALPVERRQFLGKPLDLFGGGHILPFRRLPRFGLLLQPVPRSDSLGQNAVEQASPPGPEPRAVAPAPASGAGARCRSRRLACRCSDAARRSRRSTCPCRPNSTPCIGGNASKGHCPSSWLPASSGRCGSPPAGRERCPPGAGCGQPLSAPAGADARPARCRDLAAWCRDWLSARQVQGSQVSPAGGTGQGEGEGACCRCCRAGGVPRRWYRTGGGRGGRTWSAQDLG